MTRRTRTPQQRAEEACTTANRAVDRLEKKRNQLTTDLAAVQAEYEQAVVRQQYLAQHPDLHPNQGTTNQSGDTTP